MKGKIGMPILKFKPLKPHRAILIITSYNHFNKRLLVVLEGLGRKWWVGTRCYKKACPNAVIQSWRGIEALMNSARQAIKPSSQMVITSIYHSVEDHYYVDPLPVDELSEVEATNIVAVKPPCGLN